MRLALRTVTVCLMLVLGFTHADNHVSTLTVKPERCIGLQQGQVCYATLKFKWTTPASGEFCLFDERQADPLVCWIGSTQEMFTQKFKSNTNVTFEIRRKNDREQLVLARALVKVSWVYKSNNSSTSRWRLF